MWQVPDEAHRVRQRHRAARLAQIQLPGAGIERGEQLVSRIGPGFHQRIEEGRFAGVGITDERYIEGISPFTLTSLGLTLTLDLDQTFLDFFDALANHASVKFDLGFTRAAAQTDAATLALQVRPAAHQARADVLLASEFDLQLALMALCPLAEDLQNQQGAVVDRQFQVTL